MLDYLDADSVLEREPLARLAADGELRAYRHEGFWDCMDTYKDAVVLNDLWDAGRAPWRVWDAAGGGAVKRALVTGGHGFVASNLARALLERGDAVTVLDLAPPPRLRARPAGDRARGGADRGRRPRRRAVGAAIDAGEFDVVFHLAAQTLVGPAMADPPQTFEVNVRGTWILLEACRRADVPAVVVASSDKAYGPSDELPYREEMRLRPASPYEASKAAADAIALSYRPAYGLPVAVTRFANIYGGGDLNFSRLIPEAIAAVLDGRRPQIRSDGSPERDFLYVDDAVAAYLAVEHAVGAGGPGAGEAFNAGGERPHSVAEVLETIVAVSGTDLEPEFHGTGNPAGEIDRQFVDSTKLREMTGWRPEVELRDGLVRTLEWYREHPSRGPAAPSSLLPCAGDSRSPPRTRRRSPTASRSSWRRRWSAKAAAKSRRQGRSGRRNPRPGSAASTSRRPRRSSSSAPRPNPRRPSRASARRG